MPRSWTAGSLLLVSGVLVVLPALLLAFLGLIEASGCFIECTEPPSTAQGAAYLVPGVLLLALPAVAVRFYQGAASETAARRRLAVLAVLGLLVALAEANLFLGWDLLGWL